MLENLCILELLWYNATIKIMPSKKASGADNQQERLDWWIAGFTDGEGTFSVSINRNPTTSSGYQVFPEFVITQGEKSLKALEYIQRRFACGKIYVNRRRDDHNENLYRFVVRAIPDLREKVIPFFSRNGLKTAKANDFKYFCKVIELMAVKKHLERSGFKKILMLASRMNRKQSRILNDYTSESRG